MGVASTAMRLQKIKRVINPNWDIIEGDSTLKTVFPEKPLISYRHPHNCKKQGGMSSSGLRKENMAWFFNRYF